MTADISLSPGNRELFNKFIKLCKESDSSPDMTKILQSKVEKHYERANTKYTNSKEFKDLLTNLYSEIETAPNNCYVFIADLVRELRSRKASDDSGPPLKKARIEEASASVSAEESETYEFRKRDKKIKTLNKTLRKLQKAIARLEEQEVDLDDDNDSQYIKVQRFKQRACKVFEKLCEYTNEPKDAGRVFKRRIIFRGTGCLSDPKFEKVNKCIGKYINSTGVFPDYADVLCVIKSANDEEKLNLSETEIENVAKTAFTDIGDQLQRLRRDDDADTMLSLLGKANHSDPADNDPELNAKLEANKKHWGKIDEIIEDFVRQEKDKKKSDNGDDGDDNDDNDNQSASNESEDEDDIDKEDDNGGDYLNSEREDKSSDDDTEDDDDNGNQHKETDCNATDQGEKREGQTDEKDENDPKKEVESERYLKQHQQGCTSGEVVSETRENRCTPSDNEDQRISLSDIPCISSKSNEQDSDRNGSTNGVCEKEIHHDFVGNEKCAKENNDMLSETNISELHKELDDSDIVVLSDANSNSAKFLSIPKTSPKCEANYAWDDWVDANKFVKVEKEEFIPHKSAKIRVRSAESLGGHNFESPRRQGNPGIAIIDVIDLD